MKFSREAAVAAASRKNARDNLDEYRLAPLTRGERDLLMAMEDSRWHHLTGMSDGIPGFDGDINDDPFRWAALESLHRGGFVQAGIDEMGRVTYELSVTGYMRARQVAAFEKLTGEPYVP